MRALKLREGDRLRVGDTALEVLRVSGRRTVTLSLDGPRTTPVEIIQAATTGPLVVDVRGPGRVGTVWPACPGVSAPSMLVHVTDKSTDLPLVKAKRLVDALAEVWAQAGEREVLLQLDLAPTFAFVLGLVAPRDRAVGVRSPLDHLSWDSVSSEPPAIIRWPEVPFAWSAPNEARVGLMLVFDRDQDLPPRPWDRHRMYGLGPAVVSPHMAHRVFWPRMLEWWGHLIGCWHPTQQPPLQTIDLFLPPSTPPGLAWLMGRAAQSWVSKLLPNQRLNVWGRLPQGDWSDLFHLTRLPF